MFSYQQIARWLTFPIDPITVEDWVANREMLGENKRDNSGQTEELEMAYRVETLRAGREESDGVLNLFLLLNGTKTSGVIDRGEILVIVPVGRAGVSGRKIAEVKINYVGGKSSEKFSVFSDGVFIKELDSTLTLKLEINLGSDLRLDGKSKVSWGGAGKKLLVFDGRGRPISDFGPGVSTQELMKKIKGVLL